MLQTLGTGGGTLDPFYYSSYFLRRSKIDFMKPDLIEKMNEFLDATENPRISADAHVADGILR